MWYNRKRLFVYAIFGNRDVWNKLGNMSKEDAMKAYIKQLEKLVPKWREWKAPKAKL